MLDSYFFVDSEVLFNFLQTTHNDKNGGFGKTPGDYPDILHSYLGLSALSIAGEETLCELFVPLGISVEAHSKLLKNRYSKTTAGI